MESRTDRINRKEMKERKKTSNIVLLAFIALIIYMLGLGCGQYFLGN